MKRALMVVMLLLALLGVAAAYYIYAPTPNWPTVGLQRYSIEVQGRQRSFSVFTPPRMAPGARVLIALHPSRANGDMMRSQVGGFLDRLAVSDDVIVVYPDGHEGHFNDCRRVADYSARTLNIDDIGFMRRIVERLVADQGADPKRVDVIGYSNGAHMALRLVLEAPDLVRGAVAVAGNVPTSDNMDCRTDQKPAARIVLIEGTRDPINPYLGGNVAMFGLGSRGTVLSAQESASWLSQRLGLAPAGDLVIDQTEDIRVRQQDWTAHKGWVRLVSLEGGGHTIPQSHYRYPRLMGATYLKDDVLESSLRLLETNP